MNVNRFHRSRRKRPILQEAEQWRNRGTGGGMRAEDYVSAAERKARVAQLAIDLDGKLREHLPRSHNLELVILKCHLLIEFMLNQYIDLIAPTEGVIQSERFSFKQKETLVHMLGFPPDPLFFPSIDVLNSARNSVAHTLAVDRKQIDQLLRINSEEPNDAKELTDGQRASALKQITRFLCWQLLGAIEAKHELEWMDNTKANHVSEDRDHKPADPPH